MERRMEIETRILYDGTIIGEPIEPQGKILEFLLKEIIPITATLAINKILKAPFVCKTLSCAVLSIGGGYIERQDKFSENIQKYY